MTGIKKILVINDESDTNMLMSIALKNKGYKIENAKGLGEGKAIFKELKPELLFLDINLPDGNGLNHICYFKENLPLVKICVISANDDIYKAYDYHADGILIKPFSLAQIIEKTKELIGE
ncbi:MAG: response regulator [Bacteroidota bacterium]